MIENGAVSQFLEHCSPKNMSHNVDSIADKVQATTYLNHLNPILNMADDLAYLPTI